MPMKQNQQSIPENKARAAGRPIIHAPFKRDELPRSSRDQIRGGVVEGPWYCRPYGFIDLRPLLRQLCDDDGDGDSFKISSSPIHEEFSSRIGSKSVNGVSTDGIYDYYRDELLPAVGASLPLLLSRVSEDSVSWIRGVGYKLLYLPSQFVPFTRELYGELLNIHNNTLNVYSTPNLSDLLLKHFDLNKDGVISTSEWKKIPIGTMVEMTEQAFENHFRRVSNERWWSWWGQMWPMLDWKVGFFLWQSCGGLLVLILIASIVPGRLHSFCGKVLRWPILFFTYVMISIELFLYVALRFFIKFLEYTFANPKHRFLRNTMEKATSYKEWLKNAKLLDESQKRNLWIKTSADESTCRLYNWAFIRELMVDLRMARNESDSLLALAVLQQCTRKNVGGVMSEDMFSYTNTGETKKVVEEFIEEVVKTICWLTQQANDVSSGTLTQSPDRRDDDSRTSEDSDEMRKYKESLENAVTSSRLKLHETLISWATLNFLKGKSNESDKEMRRNENEKKLLINLLPKTHRETVKVFLKRSRAAYGRTALVLSGGAMMGCYHFGTVKALLDEDVLPNIIAGTSAGSVVGATICTRDEEELKRDLNPEVLNGKLKCFSRSWPDRIRGLYKDGHLFLTEDWLKLIKWFTCGDLTFEEAYRKTGRVLCITLCATTKKAPPVLLNYITAPNVVIASAIVASAAVPGFIPPVLLQVKGTDGVVRKQDENKDQTYWDGSIEQDIPINGLAETFNCRFFLVAQANPHIVPFFFNNKGAVGKPNRWSSGLREDAWRGGFLLSAMELYLKNDMKSKFVFLRDLDAAVGFTGTLMTQSYEGTTTIVPQVKFMDYFVLFSNPSLAFLRRCFQGGAVAAYQKIAMMKAHYSIAHALDECLAILEEGDNAASNRRRQVLLQRRKSRVTGQQLVDDSSSNSVSELDDEYEVGFDGIKCGFSHQVRK